MPKQKINGTLSVGNSTLLSHVVKTLCDSRHTIPGGAIHGGRRVLARDNLVDLVEEKARRMPTHRLPDGWQARLPAIKEAILLQKSAAISSNQSALLVHVVKTLCDSRHIIPKYAIDNGSGVLARDNLLDLVEEKAETMPTHRLPDHWQAKLPAIKEAILQQKSAAIPRNQFALLSHVVKILCDSSHTIPEGAIDSGRCVLARDNLLDLVAKKAETMPKHHLPDGWQARLPAIKEAILQQKSAALPSNQSALLSHMVETLCDSNHTIPEGAIDKGRCVLAHGNLVGLVEKKAETMPKHRLPDGWQARLPAIKEAILQQKSAALPRDQSALLSHVVKILCDSSHTIPESAIDSGRCVLAHGNLVGLVEKKAETMPTHRLPDGWQAKLRTIKEAILQQKSAGLPIMKFIPFPARRSSPAPQPEIAPEATWNVSPPAVGGEIIWQERLSNLENAIYNSNATPGITTQSSLPASPNLLLSSGSKRKAERAPENPPQQKYARIGSDESWMQNAGKELNRHGSELWEERIQPEYEESPFTPSGFFM